MGIWHWLWFLYWLSPFFVPRRIWTSFDSVFPKCVVTQDRYCSSYVNCVVTHDTTRTSHSVGEALKLSGSTQNRYCCCHQDLHCPLSDTPGHCSSFSFPRLAFARHHGCEEWVPTLALGVTSEEGGRFQRLSRARVTGTIVQAVKHQAAGTSGALGESGVVIAGCLHGVSVSLRTLLEKRWCLCLGRFV